MISVSRFRVTPQQAATFRAGAEAAVAQFAASPGCRDAQLVRNLDDPDLWAIITHWEQVGDYRRAFNGTEAKLALIPLLSQAIDEPSAYQRPDDLGENVPRVG
jgi:quinol monooxygenase YgiN